MTEEVEQDIRKGPSPVSEGGCGLDAYLSALGHLVAAGNYFTKYNPQSVELENVVITFFKNKMLMFSLIVTVSNFYTEHADERRKR